MTFWTQVIMVRPLTSTDRSRMFTRKSSLRIVAIACLIAFVASCGGGSSSSDSGSSDADSTGNADTAATSMADLVAAIETLDYTCSPESFVATSAERQLCLTTSSVSLSPFTWSDADTFAAEVDSELTCTVDSGLGELRSLRGDTWAISSFSISGPTADYDAEINGLLSSLQQELGGDIVSTPCA